MWVCVLHLLSDTPSAIPFFLRGPHASARVQVLLAAVALLFALAAEMRAAFLAHTLREGESFVCVVARRLQDLPPPRECAQLCSHYSRCACGVCVAI